MNAKVLNLDEFETEVQKSIVLNGKKHMMQPFSVADFIANLKTIEEYSKQPDLDVSTFLEHMVSMVQRAFPSVPEATLRNLPMDKLKAINEFVRGQTEQEAASGLEQGGVEPAKNGTGESN